MLNPINSSHGGSDIHATLNLMLIDFIMFLQYFMFASDIPMLNLATIIADLYTPSRTIHSSFISILSRHVAMDLFRTR